MISQAIENEIRRLLAEGGLSQRKISKNMRVSRGTVGAIAAGKHRCRMPSSHDAADAKGPPTRCLVCGGKVYLPCRTCEVRKLNGHGRVKLREVEGPLQCEFREPDVEKRWAELRRQKTARGELGPEEMEDTMSPKKVKSNESVEEEE